MKKLTNNEINSNLIEFWNRRGFVVRSQENGETNKFGKTHIVTVETSNLEITYVTNVLHGVNYFKITQVKDLYKNINYRACRYFYKYINLVSGVNGDIFINMFKEK